ncbi:hypothetical protein D3C85_162210 [compost metagenome]
MQQVEQVVAGDCRTVADEARVGGDDVRRVGCAAHGEELAVRDGGRVGYAAHDAAARQADAGDQDGAGRGGAAGAGGRTAQCDRDVAARGADGQFDGLAGQGHLIGFGIFLAVAVTGLGDGGRPCPCDDSLPAGADVVDGGTRNGQGAARGDLALVVGDGAAQRHGATRQDLAGVGRDGAGFGDGFFDLVVGEGCDQAVIEVGVEVANAPVQLNVRGSIRRVGIFVCLAAGRFSSAFRRAVAIPLRRHPDGHGPGRWRDAEDGPHTRIGAVDERLGNVPAIAPVPTRTRYGFGDIRDRDRCGLASAALFALHVIKRRSVSRCRIPV